MRLLVCGVAVLCLGSVAWGEVPPPTGGEIVAPDAKLELLFTRSAPIKGGLTEGPATAPDGSIYFSDIPEGSDKGMILRFDPKTKKVSVFTDDSRKSNGLEFNKPGELISAEGADIGGRAIAKWDIQTGMRTVIADKYMGKRFNAPNDLTVDSQDRIYFTDPRYLGDEPRELEHRAVYRINPDRSVIEITHDVEKPNGIALSPDQKTLYVADNNNGTDKIGSGPPPKKGAMKIYSFALNKDGLVEGQRKTIVDFGDRDGCDGMTVDADGRIYLTVRAKQRPGVMVINPAGKEVAFIPTGEPQPDAQQPTGLPSNVTFGRGSEIKTLYITVDKSLYRIPLKVDGFHR
jgi:gluconolactonase